MNLEHLKSFIAVVDTGSFHAAARLRQLSQPALTKQIQAFEAWLGAPVLVRSRTGATPTATGLELIPEARGVIVRAEMFADRARRVGAGDVGSLAVGFGMSTVTQVPELVRRFRDRFPDVRVTLEDLASTEQAQHVRAGRLDVGFGRRPVDPHVGFHPLWRDGFAFATLERNVTAPLAAELLRTTPLVQLAPEKGPGLATQRESLERVLGYRFTAVTVTHDLLTVIAMAAAGVGAALVPYSARSIAPPNLELIPLSQPEAQWTVGAMWRRDRLSSAARNLIDLALAAAGKRGSDDPLANGRPSAHTRASHR